MQIIEAPKIVFTILLDMPKKTGVRERASEGERDLCSSAVCERERETNCCAGMCLPFG